MKNKNLLSNKTYNSHITMRLFNEYKNGMWGLGRYTYKLSNQVLRANVYFMYNNKNRIFS